MAELADGFVAMPGGLGTLEEIFEVWTWAQLGHHRKPCALLNTGGYYDRLAVFLDHAVAEGFVQPPHRAMLIVESDVEALLAAVQAYEAPAVPKYLGRGQTRASPTKASCARRSRSPARPPRPGDEPQ